MDADFYRTELWEDLKQVHCNLLYMDELRSWKAKIEPFYKGCTGIVALAAAIASFTGIPLLIQAMAALTATGIIFPMFFPVFPTSGKFSEIDALRTSLKDRLTELEGFWGREKSESEYEQYRLNKIKYSMTESKVSALFGKINEKWNERVLKASETYLDQFTFS